MGSSSDKDKKNKMLILLGILIGVVVLAAVALVLLLSQPAKTDSTEAKRLNVLKRAQEYDNQGEFQRALDLLDKLLIDNADDKDAKALSDKIVEEKKNKEDADKDNQLKALKNANDDLKNSLSSLGSQLAKQQKAPPSADLSGAKADEEKQKLAQRQKEEAQRLAKEKADSEKLSATEKAKRELLNDGISLLNQGKYPQAREKFAQVLDKDPDNSEALIRTGESYFLENKASADNRKLALDNLSKGLAKDNKNAHGWGVQGDVYGESKNWNEAISSYHNSLKNDPNNAGVWYELGKAYFNSRQYQQAADAFETSIKYDGTNPLAFNALGSSYAQLKNDKKAQESFTKAVKLKPDFAIAHYQLGRSLMNQNKIDLAVKSFETAVKLDGNRSAYLRELGSAYFILGRYQEAETQFSKAVVLSDKEAVLHYNLSTTQLMLGKLTPALEHAQKAISLDPSVSVYFFNLGQCLEKAGSSDLAINAYNNAIRLDGNFTDPRVNLALLMEKKGDSDGAMEQLQKAFELNPSNPIAINDLGHLYIEKKLYTQAVDFFRKAMEKSDIPDIRFNLATAYVNSNQKDLAKTVLQDLIKLSPQYWDAYYLLGGVLYDLGDSENGKKIYQELLSKNPRYGKKAEIESILQK